MNHRSTWLALITASLLSIIWFANIADAQGPNPRAPRATFTVNSTTDAVDAAPGNGVCATVGSVCTLRAAIQEANALAGDDTIIVPAGTYTLTIAGAGEDAATTGDLDITSNLIINGGGAGITIINANWVDRVLHVTGVFAVNISGVTITHGNASGGGIRNDGGTLAITNSTIFDNNSGTDSGGIFSSGTLNITNSTISDNNAGTDAGGIRSSGAMTITNSTFSTNNAGADGGAIFSSSTLAVTNSTFSTNNAGSDGGGIFGSGTLAVTNSTFSNNNTLTNGGAIYSTVALTVTSSTFSTNNAGNGGAISDGGGTIAITHSTFSGNTASTGGGIRTRFAVTVANSTFSDNDAGSGDAIYTSSGTLGVTNSTIFGRIAEEDGPVAGPVIGGGGVYNNGGTITLRNTIVASHDSGGNCVGVITNGGNNIDDRTTCGWGSANGSMSNTNPLLGALTGSPAYFSLNKGSPAIDAGNNAVCAAAPVNNTSQNGITRPTDGDGNGTAICDMGAFEVFIGMYLPYIVK
ncbi:hypothetical protein ANRL3_01334 [Anaerolineae bacterium]|nr:hypothetical protein ANRL3_01334 [Anaerolineae bacterium]